MNDDAAHREEHIGEHLQNADWEKRQVLLPTFRVNTILPSSPYAKWKTALTLLPFVTWPSGRSTTSRQVQAGAVLLGALPGPNAADKGLSGFEIPPCPPRPGNKRMSGRLRPAAHGTNMELRRVGRH